jgi:hypothetical protein
MTMSKNIADPGNCKHKIRAVKRRFIELFQERHGILPLSVLLLSAFPLTVTAVNHNPKIEKHSNVKIDANGTSAIYDGLFVKVSVKVDENECAKQN